MDLALSMPDLKVMLIFDSQDHSQAAADKPHIHQAFQGFRFAALLRWVRLNPDSSYQLTYMENTTGSHLPDNPANSQPENWLEIDTWALPRGNLDRQAASWAALAEMSDRAHAGRWDENLGDILYESYLSTPQP
jgi:hypothetical protein